MPGVDRIGLTSEDLTGEDVLDAVGVPGASSLSAEDTVAAVFLFRKSRSTVLPMASALTLSKIPMVSLSSSCSAAFLSSSSLSFSVLDFGAPKYLTHRPNSS